MKFPFKTSDFISAYKRQNITPVTSDWATTFHPSDPDAPGIKCGCPLAALIADRFDFAAAVKAGRRRNDHAAIAKLLGLTVAQVKGFVSGFDEGEDWSETCGLRDEDRQAFKAGLRLRRRLQRSIDLFEEVDL